MGEKRRKPELSNMGPVSPMDANAKNKLWESSRTDKKGAELEHLIIKNNLNVANVPNSKLEYIPSKTSKVDVTLYGDKVKISGWKFLNTVSLSDHPYIHFELMVGRPNRQPKEPKVLKLTNIDKSKLRSTLDSELRNLNVNWDGLQSEADLDGIVNNITAIIGNSAIKSELPRNKQSKS
ncbi:Uncharacterized protein APZ42_009505, partial [Daphnia magna]